MPLWSWPLPFLRVLWKIKLCSKLNLIFFILMYILIIVDYPLQQIHWYISDLVLKFYFTNKDQKVIWRYENGSRVQGDDWAASPRLSKIQNKSFLSIKHHILIPGWVENFDWYINKIWFRILHNSSKSLNLQIGCKIV